MTAEKSYPRAVRPCRARVAKDFVAGLALLQPLPIFLPFFFALALLVGLASFPLIHFAAAVAETPPPIGLRKIPD